MNITYLMFRFPHFQSRSTTPRRTFPSLRVLFVFLTILGSTAFLGLYVGFENSPSIHLQRFSSTAELSNYIETHNPPPLLGEWGFFLGMTPGMTLSQNMENTPRGMEGTAGYSTTNVQVEGVDEPDCVKTDGQYIYAIIDTEVVIVEANPVETVEVVNRFEPTMIPHALFLHPSGLLVILGHGFGDTMIEVYDVSDPQSISLSSWMTIDGHYQGARMIGAHLYLLTNEYAGDGEITNRPWVETASGAWIIAAEQIYYDPGNYDWSYYYTTIASLNVTDPEAIPDIETILTGDSSCTLYSSLSNIYLAISRFPILSRNWFDRQTTIHRFQIHEGDTTYCESGIVPGFLINQFALDEAGSYLRVATTSWYKGDQFLRFESDSWIQASNVYILDMNMQIRGRVERLAPGESIYSVRFVGNTGYLVTFYKTDPLFIVDLTNPHAPRVMGELVIPGYSDYLHPLDNGMLLGIGKDVVTSGSEDWWWYQGVKVSLFNTTDPYHPEEIQRLIFGVRGSDSEVLHDHKAVLVDVQRGLFVMPILLAEHEPGSNPDSYDFGEIIWQGAYVFELNTTSGTITLRAEITHIDNIDDFRNDWWTFQSSFVRRSLYIGDVLFTLSQSKLMYHDLADFSYIGETVLSLEIE